MNSAFIPANELFNAKPDENIVDEAVWVRDRLVYSFDRIAYLIHRNHQHHGGVYRNVTELHILLRHYAFTEEPVYVCWKAFANAVLNHPTVRHNLSTCKHDSQKEGILAILMREHPIDDGNDLITHVDLFNFHFGICDIPDRKLMKLL
jgi:hypothetical protein